MNLGRFSRVSHLLDLSCHGGYSNLYLACELAVIGLKRKPVRANIKTLRINTTFSRCTNFRTYSKCKLSSSLISACIAAGTG